MFYIPYQGNGAEMNRLRGVLTRYIDRLRAGQMYVSVSSYAASKTERQAHGAWATCATAALNRS